VVTPDYSDVGEELTIAARSEPVAAECGRRLRPAHPIPARRTQSPAKITLKLGRRKVGTPRATERGGRGGRGAEWRDLEARRRSWI
jgi:hypothetical protein